MKIHGEVSSEGAVLNRTAFMDPPWIYMVRLRHGAKRFCPEWPP
jgi:hypothetical protein